MYRVDIYGEVPALYGAGNKNSKSLINSLKGVLVKNGYSSPIKYGQYMFFGCERLEYLGIGVLGENLKNCRSLAHMFDGAKIKNIPENSLAYCENLIDAGYIFEACDIEELPANLFKNCPKLKSLTHAFHRCDYLKEIPEGFLDYNTELETLEQAFKGCRRLETVPSDLFDNCKKIKDVRFAFSGESLIAGYSSTQESLTSDVPPLWNRTDLPYEGTTMIGEESWYNGYARGCIHSNNYATAQERGWT